MEREGDGQSMSAKEVVELNRSRRGGKARYPGHGLGRPAHHRIQSGKKRIATAFVTLGDALCRLPGTARAYRASPPLLLAPFPRSRRHPARTPRPEPLSMHEWGTWTNHSVLLLRKTCRRERGRGNGGRDGMRCAGSEARVETVSSFTKQTERVDSSTNGRVYASRC